MAPPLVCGGFSLFDNGEMAVFRTSPEPQKHHTLQIWQTPYVGLSWQPEMRPDSFLFRLGNPELVRCLAEAQEVLTLLAKDDTFAGLYLDLVRRTTDIVDTYFWLGRPEAFALAEKICANGPLAVRTAKEIAVRALNNEPNFVLEKAIGARVFSSADAKEGPKAFAEKRKPVWKGR